MIPGCKNVPEIVYTDEEGLNHWIRPIRPLIIKPALWTQRMLIEAKELGLIPDTTKD